MKALFAALILLFSLSVSAQEVLVYFTKGEASVLRENKKQRANEGMEIDEKSTLLIEEGAMVVLMQKERAIVLKDEGEYSFTQISKQFAETKRSVSDRYIAYIWKQAHAEDKDFEDSGDGNMSVTGMVSRGEGGILSPDDSVIVVNQAFVLEFVPEVIPGYLYIYEGKKPILNTALDSAVLELKFGGIFEQGKWYGIAANVNNQSPYSGIRYFKWASEVESTDIQMEMAKLLSEIEGYPAQVKDDIIKAYLALNRYIYYISKR
jgi:hypothetical protein